MTMHFIYKSEDNEITILLMQISKNYAKYFPVALKPRYPVLYTMYQITQTS